MVSPTAVYGSPPVMLLAMVRAGLWSAVAVASSVGGTRVPPAGVPVAPAWLVTEPASRSSWVTVWNPKQVVLWVGARVVARQTGPASVLSSVTATALIVTLPVLVTR